MISTERKEIIEFFLNIFKVQMNLSGRPGQYHLISEENGEGDQIFELRVRDQDQWVSRRMTISPLGDESGSKSKCFKIIYDDMIVVKIPPVPMTDFPKYFEAIQAERRIAGRLDAEIPCVTPSLSAILRKIPPFSNEPDINAPAFEERCYQKISILPVFQKYLKIGKTFAFFMNLSRYSFLGQIIDHMHDITQEMGREIAGQADILGSPMMFEEIYGTDGTGVFFSLDGIYGAYEEALKRLQRTYHIPAIASYSKKEWFLAHLSQKSLESCIKSPVRLSVTSPSESPVPSYDDQLSPDFLDDRDRMIENILAAEPKVIDTFMAVIRKYVCRKLFLQNKERMSGMITNLLEQLAILKKKEIALRDLKPDNVFIAGDLAGDSFLLETPENYSIGLIDFETSVTFAQRGDDVIPQPLLAGTPSYSTVSHLFTNETLAKSHPRLTRILHLQDWYAVNGMIYNIVTGQRLGRETGRLMPKMIRDIKMCAQKNIPMIDIYRKLSGVFWKSAAEEFKRKLGENRIMLKDVKVLIPKKAKEMLKEEVISTAAVLDRRMQRLLKHSSATISSRDTDALAGAESGMVVQWRNKLEKEGTAPRLPKEVRRRMVDMLENLAAAKAESERIEQFLTLLTFPNPVVPADMILEIMFLTVLHGMHRPAWGEIKSRTAPER